MDFDQFQLNEALRRGLGKIGFTAPTPIQAGAIPPALDGRDVLGIAQTGTGKTAAFLLPSMQRLLHENVGTRPHAPSVVVLAPTRELAVQIFEHARQLSQFTRLRSAAVYGGSPLGRQAKDLREGVQLVIATPGRLLDHLQRRNVRLDAVRTLVLDEADRMLDMGFLPDIQAIVQRMPEDRQTLLFSATMPASVQALTRRFLRRPVRVELENARPPEALHQQVYPVPKHLKTALLIALLRGAGVDSALVFTRTKQDADVAARKLREAGLAVAEMHGDFPQKERERALRRFRDGQAKVLVATNIAARGLDIEGISHVINYDVPEDAESYVHRIGRTARVDAHGVAWTLASPDDEPLISGIEYLLGRKVERVRLAGFDYDVPTPDWAKPSRASILRAASRNRSVVSRWKSLAR
jgi:ATP-dependent RNA helicase RhlE